MLLQLATTLALLLIPITTLRLLCILPHNRLSGRRKQARPEHTPTHLLIVLGSGGHTAEMFSLIRNLNTSKYTHRTYVVSSGDTFSADLARKFEQSVLDKTTAASSGYGSFAIATVPRARKIHQSIYTAPFSSLLCLFFCLKLLAFGTPLREIERAPGSASGSTETSQGRWPPSTKPDLIMTNGPATGVIVVAASLILRFFSLSTSTVSNRPSHGVPARSPRGEMRTVYIESWARVTKLSLSGKILLYVVDRFIVQWKQLTSATKGRGEYLGVLVE